MSSWPPEQQWSQPARPGSRGGPLLGVLALCLGVAGVVVTFLPVDLTGTRAYLAWVFGLPGLVVAVFGLLGDRAGKAMAAIGAVLSLLAVAIGVITIGNVVGVL
ncbi:hypothetical protein SAMN05216188_108127 [Lentzea xinjiangensis]|uniref:Uncharacterized protein n=1 Tax=Lentzea xinjiangensis TaxID=402600 RepID=A0A1H9LVV9_9PSEU|nr:hypothetical protein [Lentzea xinjiangensis]SER15576.1 hypothetical protein SAMN05216188_108127 [Lentzea xinjiangensis]